MRDEFLRLVGGIVIGVIILIGALAGFKLLSISPLWSEQGAAWVQAIGSIAAIYGTFFIFRRQYEQDKIAEHARLAHDAKKFSDNELAARTLAVRNLVQVATVAVESAAKLVDAANTQQPAWEFEQHSFHMDYMRAVLDTLVTPTTEHLALITALSVSKTLTQTKHDLSHLGGSKRDEMLLRATGRVAEAHLLISNLISIQTEMLDLCRERNIPIEIADFRRR